MTELSGTEIYAAFREKVLAYFTARADCREDAEDLCSDVFVKVLSHLPDYDPEKASLSTWIYQITRFTYIDYLRTKHPSDPLDDEIADTDDLEEEFINKETLERLASVLKTLQEDERDIIVLRYYKGMTLTEISRLTGISYGMVKFKHTNALRALRAGLELDPEPFL